MPTSRYAPRAGAHGADCVRHCAIRQRCPVAHAGSQPSVAALPTRQRPRWRGLVRAGYRTLDAQTQPWRAPFPLRDGGAVDTSKLPAISNSCGNSKWCTQATALTSCLVSFTERTFVTVKTLATGMAALAAIGAAAGGVKCIASVTAVSPRVQPVVFGAPSPASGRYPQPLDPPAPAGGGLPPPPHPPPAL